MFHSIHKYIQALSGVQQDVKNVFYKVLERACWHIKLLLQIVLRDNYTNQCYCTSRCLTMLTTSRVEYGYVIRPWSAIVRSSPNARTNRRNVSSGTWGPYCCSIDISDCMSGLSIAWQLNISPTKTARNYYIQLHVRIIHIIHLNNLVA